MNIETQNAYNDAKKTLSILEGVYKQLVNALERKANAEVNLDSVTAQVTDEKENSDVSKTALRELVKGDKRVIEARAELTLANLEVKKADCRVDYITKMHDLEKKRMTAEMEDNKRLPLTD